MVFKYSRASKAVYGLPNEVRVSLDMKSSRSFSEVGLYILRDYS